MWLRTTQVITIHKTAFESIEPISLMEDEMEVQLHLDIVQVFPNGKSYLEYADDGFFIPKDGMIWRSVFPWEIRVSGKTHGVLWDATTTGSAVSVGLGSLTWTVYP